MSSKKRLIAILFAFVLFVTLACGGNDDNPNQKNGLEITDTWLSGETQFQKDNRIGEKCADNQCQGY